MILFYKIQKSFGIMLTVALFFVIGNSYAKDDNRTPFEKYQGAYVGAYLICAVQQKIIYVRERSGQSTTALEKGAGDDLDMDSCKANGLARMKEEYTRVLPLVRGEEARAALREHYVHAVMHMKEITPWPNEDESTYMERMNRTFRKSRELYVRFEITQP